MKLQNLWLTNCKSKSQIKNKIIRILLCCMASSAAAAAHADSRMDKMRQEFFKENAPAKKENASQVSVQPKGLFEIQSVSKGTMSDFEYDNGSGTRQVRCISVKFKYNGEKESLIPVFYAYVYDNNKKLIDRLESANIYIGAESKEIDLNSFRFKPRKTYIVMLDYPVDLNFKYFLAVVGNKKYVAVEIKPGSSSISDFDFEEKAQYLRQSGTS